MKYAFAGDRDISVTILEFLIHEGFRPSALMIPPKAKASHAEELIRISGLSPELIFEGKEFREEKAIASLQQLGLDYIFGIHFPFIVPQAVLDIPKIGTINLHPAYLPYNKGWHVASWTILENTPPGATLHFMVEKLDAGDIIHQKNFDLLPTDTGDTLYRKLKDAEIEVFKEAFPALKDLTPPRQKQTALGTAHSKKDLAGVQQINLEEKTTGDELLRKLRAFTTNKIEEAAYFMKDGQKYFVRIEIKKAD